MVIQVDPESAEAVADEPNRLPLDSFLNVATGTIGRTVSTKFEPNTSSRFLFWVGKRAEMTAISLEIGNIVAARSDDLADVTFGAIVEMRSYSDVDSFIADYLSHDFGDAKIEVPTDVSEVVVVTCDVMRNLSVKNETDRQIAGIFSKRYWNPIRIWHCRCCRKCAFQRRRDSDRPVREWGWHRRQRGG